MKVDIFYFGCWGQTAGHYLRADDGSSVRERSAPEDWPNSNSAFLARGLHSFDEIRRLAQFAFPLIWERFTFEVKERNKTIDAVKLAVDNETARITKIINDHGRAHELGLPAAMHGVSCFHLLVGMIQRKPDEEIQ